jgi:hypothetical protein
MWKDFEDFYKLIASIEFFWKHALANFLALTHFQSSWVEFKKLIGVLGPNFEPAIPWKLKLGGGNDTNCAMWKKE